MEPTFPSVDRVHSEEFANATVQLVRQWLAESASIKPDRMGQQLADILADREGLDFTVEFIDGVIRPQSTRVAARVFRRLAAHPPQSLPWYLRAALRAGSCAARWAPDAVIALVRRALRLMVGHLIVDASDRQLGRSLARIRRSGARPNVNLLGEAVLGSHEADRRLAGTRDLIRRQDVDYVSLKVSAAVAPHSPWAFDAAVEDIVDRLAPLYREAAATTPATFINLDMEEYHDLDLTLAVFRRLLDDPAMTNYYGGIVLQAYLPDAMGAMVELQDWAAQRRARGGAAIKVRLVKGANLPMEHVDARMHGWPLATWSTKVQTDTHYKRVLDYSLTTERAQNVHLGIAGHNLFDIAWSWLVAQQRGVTDHVEFEMLLGMATSQAQVVRQAVGGLLLYTPVVRPAEFDVAIAYLVRRLDEGASPENFMSAVFSLDESPLFSREENRFRAALAALADQDPPSTHRVQDRNQSNLVAAVGFENAPDSDPATKPNRAWMQEIIDRIGESTIGAELVQQHTVESPADIDQILERAVSSQWGEVPAGRRAQLLRGIAVQLERQRAELIEVMASECGKTVDQADPEVSEAIDFANYYAQLAEKLDETDGAIAEPVGLTVVTPPWNFPVAIPAGSVLAALAAGSPVVIKPAPQAPRCAAVLVSAMRAAGIDDMTLQLVNCSENEAGEKLVSDPRVDRLILTGGYETAELFRTFRPDLPLLAETSGKNALIISESADLDLAVKDLVQSAFGHAGQKCSAASLAIVVGSVAESQRFFDQLTDAVTSLTVDYPTNAEAQVGPVIEPASGKLLGALTQLGAGESWLVEPRQLDDTGRLWSPGVKVGVKPGSEFHLTEYFGPVLGVMAAETLDEATTWQNAVDYGLTAGLHSLDSDEVSWWLDRVQAGNVYVNRGITGAIVQRQPFGGWKKSAVGPGTKAGGPNYLIGLSNWRRTEAAATHTMRPEASRLWSVTENLDIDRELLRRSYASDAEAWESEFSQAHDRSGLGVERNVLRYVPVPVSVRHELGGDLTDLLRVIGAGLVARSEFRVSLAEPLPDDLTSLVSDLGVSSKVEDQHTWAYELDARNISRVRLVGGSRDDVILATRGRADLAIYAQPVTESGRVELLPFLIEQAVSATAHRFGQPHRLANLDLRSVRQ